MKIYFRPRDEYPYCDKVYAVILLQKNEYF
jgi:hypothetical protein